jgi:hypothetical protein
MALKSCQRKLILRAIGEFQTELIFFVGVRCGKSGFVIDKMMYRYVGIVDIAAR